MTPQLMARFNSLRPHLHGQPGYALYMHSTLGKVVAISIAIVGLSGCSLAETVVDTISTADVCTKASVISDDITEVVVLAVTNPLGLDTYASELRSSNEELKALKPTDDDLADALSRGTQGLDDLLDLIDDPNADIFGELPDTVARTQVAFLDAAEICKDYLD